MPRWQYQAKAEPVLVPAAAPAVPSFGWFVQASEPVRTKRQLVAVGFLAAPVAESASIIPSFGWYIVPPDVIRRIRTAQGYLGASALGAVPIIPSYDWFHQQTEVMRRKPQTRTGLYVSAFEVELIEIDLDWFVQYPEQIFRRHHQVDEGFIARGYDATELAPSFGWFQQQADVIRRRHQTQLGWLARGYDATELAPSFGWFVAPPDVIRRPPNLALRVSGLSIQGPLQPIADVTIVASTTAQIIAGKSVQYQARAAPVAEPASITPSFGWFQQRPEQVFRRLPPRQPGLFATGAVPEVFDIQGPIAAETTLVIAGALIQVQSKAEPLVIVVAPVLSFGWYVPPPDIVRRMPIRVTQPTAAPVAESASIIPSFGWNVAQPDVIRRIKTAQERLGFSVLGVPIIPSFDWFVQQCDVVRAQPQTRTGLFSAPFEAELIEIDLDWFVQYPERPIRRRHQTGEGFVAKGYTTAEITPAFGWFHQQADVIRLKPQTQVGFSVLVDFSIPAVVVPSFGWFQQQPEQVFRRRPQVQLGFFATGAVPEAFDILGPIVTEATLIVPGTIILVQSKAEPFVVVAPAVPSFDWFVQQSDIIRRRIAVREGFFARGFNATEITSSFDWFKQHPEPALVLRRPQGLFVLAEVIAPVVNLDWFVDLSDVIQRRVQIRPGFYARGYDATELAPSFGWFCQQADIIRRRHQTQTGLFVRGLTAAEIAAVPAFDWFRQYPEPLPKPIRPQGLLVKGYTDAEITPNFGWFHEQADVTRRRPQTRTGFFFLVEFNVPAVLNLDWFQQQTDIIRRKPQTQIGFFTQSLQPIADITFVVATTAQVILGRSVQYQGRVEGQPEKITTPPITWFQQYPERPIRRRHQTGKGFVAKGYDATELAPSFGWFHQQTEVMRRKPQVRTGLSVLVDFSIPVPEIVTLDKWWQQQANPFIRVLRPSSAVVFTFFQFPAAVVFLAAQKCLLLADVYTNTLLPSPSGFQAVVQVLPIPSGFQAPSEDPPAPSGFQT